MKKLFAFLLSICLCVWPVSALDTQMALSQTVDGLPALLGTKSYLKDNEVLPAGTSVSDWLVLALALSGEKANTKDYADRLRQYVEDAYKTQGGFGEYNATQWHRIALTAAAMGYDPTDFGADLIADGTYNFAGEDLTAQGLNACIFALLTLDCKDYTVPEGSAYDRDKLLNHLLSSRNRDGSFGLTTGSADVDLTAMAVQAMAPYTQREEVAEAVENAFAFLHKQDWSAKGAESVAQTIIALCSVGKDPNTDGRFFLDGTTLPEHLEKYRLPDGSFAHTLADSTGNLMATEQAMLAFIAMEKQRTSGTRLYDFSQIKPAKESPLQNSLFFAAFGVFMASFGITFYSTRRKKNHV